MTVLRFAPVVLLLAAGGASARPMLGDKWPLVGFDRDADCELALRSNPIAIRMEASGLIPGETLNIVIRNGEMKPLRATLAANANGRFSEYYAPLKSAYGSRRFGAPMTFAGESGEVVIEVTAARCTLRASSPWTTVRQTIP
ncbi:MAG: hypothetical protein ACKOPM_05265 [Novosphingobium sp.]